MKNIKLFERELNLIENEELRKITTDFMIECVPSYFWEIGASSTGKYHPKFSQGVGGLVRHTKAVVMFAEELLRMNSYSYLKDDYKDYIIVACIVHDTCKYGVCEFDKTQFENHGKLASVEFHKFCIDCSRFKFKCVAVVDFYFISIGFFVFTFEYEFCKAQCFFGCGKIHFCQSNC